MVNIVYHTRSVLQGLALKTLLKVKQIFLKTNLSQLFNKECNMAWPEINVFVQIISVVVQQSYLKFKYPDRTSLPYTDNYASDEIIRFIGYAIYKTRCSWHKKLIIEDNDLYDEGLKILDNLRIFQVDALSDEAYCSATYKQNSSLRFHNNSRLTLPKMELIKFGKRLMSILNNKTREKTLLSKGNETYRNVKQYLLQDKSIRIDFTEALDKINSTRREDSCQLTHIENIILNELLTKSLNARMNATITKYNDTKNESKNKKTRQEIKEKVRNKAIEAKQRELVGKQKLKLNSNLCLDMNEE